ncbi:MAG: bifunctional 2-polyprenyl-6-hydroxyphenol methylase/3-demethylubiquinol 3-O-methyltransferase UbiG [Candidatus Berkiellales bacterium]
MANVDADEINKFDEIASEWWDLNGPMKPLHDLNPLRLDFIQSCCALHGAILDVGCGGGILTEALSRFGQVVGIDQSQKAIEVAIEHAKGLPSPPRYEFITVEDFASQHPEQFDVITCMELLEHVPSPDSIIAATATLLKPDGHLFVSTINRTPKAFAYAIVGAEYLLNLIPKGTHDYQRFLRPSELNRFAEKHGLVLKQMKGINYHPFRKVYSLCQDVSVNYLMHFQKER